MGMTEGNATARLKLSRRPWNGRRRSDSGMEKLEGKIA